MRHRFTVLPIIALIALVAAACGSSSSSPFTSPSSVTGVIAPITVRSVGSTFVPFASPGIDCPSDAPLFRAEANPYGHIDVEVQAMPKADYIRVYISRRSVSNVFEPVNGSPFVIDHGRNYIEVPVSDGVYSVQVATVTCGVQRNLTDVVILGIGQEQGVVGSPSTPITPLPPVDGPVDPVDPPVNPPSDDDDSHHGCRNGSSGDHNHDGHHDCGKGSGK